MPSPCDLVQDDLTISDALAFGVAQAVPSDNLLTISDDYRIGLFTPLSDALTIDDAVIEMWTQGVSDALTIGDAIEDHLVATTLLRDALRIGDGVGVALSDLVSDALSIGDETSVGVAQTVSDSLTIGDGVSLFTAAVSLISDALRISDAVRTGFESLVADALTISDTIDERQSLVDMIADALTIGDSAGVAAVVEQLVADGLSIADAIEQALSTSSLVIDNLFIEDHASGGAPAAWSAHLEPFAMSRYTGFGFNSMAEVGGRLLLAGEGGIYLAEGADDDGAQIDARIEHDLSEEVSDGKGGMVRDPHFKRPRYLYVSYKGGQLAIDIGWVDETGAEQLASEAMPAYGATQFRTGRVPLSRGVRSHYLRPVLKNVSGATFSMNDASLVVDSVKRKA